MFLCSLTSYFFSHGYSHYGQGEVYSAIKDFFEAKKQDKAIWYPVQSLPEHRPQMLKRKTMRSLVEPQQNKGWRGGR